VVGLSGGVIFMPDLKVDIIATATAGTATTNGVQRSGVARATAIEASDALYINASGVKIHAVTKAPDGLDLPGTSKAYSILGGSGDDAVILNNVSLIGSVDLGGGSNRFVVAGDTSLHGGLMSSGGGVNQIELQSGLLKFGGGPFALGGLKDDQLVVGKDSGLGFELATDPADSTRMDIQGKLVVEDGASIGAYAAVGQMAGDIIGTNTYTVITTTDTNGFGGTFVESKKSMFTLEIDSSSGSNVMVKATGMRPLDAARTPAGNSVAKATLSSASSVMSDLSGHAGFVRALMRTPRAEGQDAEEKAPEGAMGPDMAERRRLETGDWIGYVRQLNYMGSQDSDGGYAGYDWDTIGFLVGAEKMVDNDLVVGGAAGGIWTDVDGSDGASSGDSSMFIANAYGNWFSETWYMELGGTYGHAWNDAGRIGFQGESYTGDFDSNLLGAWLEGGYTMLKDKYEVEPYGRAAYILGLHGSYTDGGGSQPLSVDSSTSHNLLAELGVRGSRNWMLESGGLLRLGLVAGLRMELLDASIEADGTLVGAGVGLSSAESDRLALVLGAKGDWVITDKLNLGVEYEPVISGNWFYHKISGNLSYRF
jgi:uncharacterized protein with beta-barrel porin domain